MVIIDPTIRFRKALCDPLPEVRQAAAKTFDSLHSTVGVRALDDILPQLLEQLVCLFRSTLDIHEYMSKTTRATSRQLASDVTNTAHPFLLP